MIRYGKITLSPNEDFQQRQLPDYIRVIITQDSHGRKRELLIPAALDLDRPKRPRTTFQTFQIDTMEREFQLCPFVSEERRLNLAIELGLTEMQVDENSSDNTKVKVWFQNRRTKARKNEIST